MQVQKVLALLNAIRYTVYMQSRGAKAMQNTKLAKAQKRYNAAVALTQQCKAELATGGSYVLYKLAIAEEDAALQKLNALQLQLQA
jgi:hypothetical protein